MRNIGRKQNEKNPRSERDKEGHAEGTDQNKSVDVLKARKRRGEWLGRSEERREVLADPQNGTKYLIF